VLNRAIYTYPQAAVYNKEIELPENLERTRGPVEAYLRYYSCMGVVHPKGLEYDNQKKGSLRYMFWKLYGSAPIY
jgi:hypothetical protein